MQENNKVVAIIGVANTHSIAAGCARILAEKGWKLALSYQNDKAKPHVVPVASELGCELLLPLDVTKPEQIEAFFDQIKAQFSRLDALIHSIAFAPKADLQGRVVDCSAQGFATAMDISCHSLIKLTKAAENLMSHGGSIITMSYYGSERVIPQYGMMGPVKAALEATTRYLAAELAAQNIRVNAVSPGPVATRAASGLAHFDELLQKSITNAPNHQQLTIEEIGEYTAFLCSEAARHITGQVLYIDGGYSIV
jgi:enoyl-[acyl-carrier protein] reductase I